MNNTAGKACNKVASDEQVSFENVNYGTYQKANTNTMSSTCRGLNNSHTNVLEILPTCTETTNLNAEEIHEMNMLNYIKWPTTYNNNKNHLLDNNYPSAAAFECSQYCSSEKEDIKSNNAVPSSNHLENSNYNFASQISKQQMNLEYSTNTSNKSYGFDYPVQRIPTTNNTSRHNYSYSLSNQYTKNQIEEPNAQFHPYLAQESSAIYQQQLAHAANITVSGFHGKLWYPNPTCVQSGNEAPDNTNFYGECARDKKSTNYNNAATFTPDPMLNILQLSNSGREARNRAEKNRRDKLNSYIQELSGMVPHVAESPRRVDKTAVLRFAVHALRLNHVFNRALSQTPESHDVTDTLMQLMDSFFLTITCRGEILLISSSVEQQLGHCQTDLYGQNILQITHPDDQSVLKQQLIPTDIEKLLENDNDTNTGPLRSKEREEEIDKRLHEDKRNFTMRLARAGPRSEPTVYEVVKISGSFRRSDQAPRGEKAHKLPTSLHMIRRGRSREDLLPLQCFSANDIVFIAIARVIHPLKVIDRSLEDNKLEYKTRHLIDGRIIDCDQRICLVTGYMKDEVRNLSPFSFMHQDDARWVIVALRQMYDHHSSFGESTHRLLTRNGHFVYLHTKGYLEIDKCTNKVHSFVCVNTLLSDEEGRRRLQEMKNKFSIIINANIPQSSFDVPASENPQQLEKAVMCLIQNLQKTTSDDVDDDLTDELNTTIANNDDTNAVVTHNHHSKQIVRTTSASSNSALSLIPPEADSVKDSISKSVSMVSVAAAKLIRDQPRFAKSPQTVVSCDSGDEGSYNDCTLSSNTFHCSCDAQVPQVRGLKRASSICSDSDDHKIPKYSFKRKEIEEVLSSSLDQIGRNLNRQLNVAKKLQDQGMKYELSNSQQRINELLEEHHKQTELYVNIKNEYKVQLQHHNTTGSTTSSSQTQ